MFKKDFLRYIKHITLNKFNIIGQNKLLKSHTLILGIGGIGSLSSLYLSCAGIGKIIIVDYDFIDLTNLPRQVIFINNDINKFKVFF